MNRQKNTDKIRMQQLREVLSANNAFSDEVTIEQFLPKLYTLFSKKQEITQESLFKSFYQDYLTSQWIRYQEIVSLFEDFINKQSLRQKRQKYLLSHWLYYHAFQVKEQLQQEGIMKSIKSVLEKKKDANKTIEEITIHVGFQEIEAKIYKQSIQASSAYSHFVNYLKVKPTPELSSQKLEVKHKQLIYILKKMGSLGIKSIQYQIQKHILVSFQQAYEKNSDEGANAANQLIDISILYNHLISQKRMSDSIKKKIQKLKSQNNSILRFNLLQAIKSDLISIDTFLLDYLISLSRKNYYENGVHEPKKIILFVGPSGSGKTTMILKLLGYQFMQTQISQLSTFQPVDLKPEHSTLRTSPESTSTTRYMFSTKIPESSFKPGSYEPIDACDSPGFEDTAGVEVDISNSIGIQQFLKKCASVKLVVVISQRIIGQKMQGIRQLAKIVSNIVTSYKDIENSVSFVLNRFQKNGQEQKRLAPGIQSILSNLSAKQTSNKQYTAFLNSLQKNIKEKNAIHFRLQGDAQDFLEDIKQGAINNPSEIFKYSLSSKSTQLIVNRRTTLTKFVNELVGRDNHLALYYFKQLSLLSQCLNYHPEIEEELRNLMKTITKQVEQKFISFQSKINTEILQNDVSSNSFEELNKIKGQVKQFQLFKSIIPNLLDTSDLQQKLFQVKSKIVQQIHSLSYSDAQFQNSKRHVITTIKFLRKFDKTQQKQVLAKLSQVYQVNIKTLDKILQQKKYLKIKGHTVILKNIQKIIQKSREIIIEQIPEQQSQYFDIMLQTNSISQKIKKQFELIINQATKFISAQTKKPLDLKINENIVKMIEDSLKMFEELQKQGPILDEIKVYQYKEDIIVRVSNFAISLVEQIHKFLNSTNREQYQSKSEEILRTKNNLYKIKSIRQIYSNIGQQIDILWRNFQKYIDYQKNKLNEFLQDLRAQKKVNRNTLKHFKSMIDKIIKFSQGDNELIKSTNQLRRQIRKSLTKHITNLKVKIDKLRISLKSKRSLKAEQVQKYIQLFKEICAFYKVRSLRSHKYFQVSRSRIRSSQQPPKNSTSQIRQSNDEDDDDDENESYNQINISVTIEEMFASIKQKMLVPFCEIKIESQKILKKGIKKITNNYFQILKNFIQYSYYLQNNQSSKEIENEILKLKHQENSFQQSIRCIINGLKEYFDEHYQAAIENGHLQAQIFKLQPQDIKQFRRLWSIILQKVKQDNYLQEIFLQYKFCCNQYSLKITQMLNKSSEIINKQLQKKGGSSLEYIEYLFSLKQRVEELIILESLQSEKTQEFTKIDKKITANISKIEGKQQTTINNLFKTQNINILDLEKMYKYLSNDDFRHEQNLERFYQSLRTHANQKLLKSILDAKRQYEIDEAMNLANQAGNNYIIQLDKAYNFYQQISRFMSSKYLQTYPISQKFFTREIQQFRLEQKMKQTYEIAKEKLLSFEFQGKPRQFKTVVEIMRKAQNIIEKIASNNLYSQIYNSVEKYQQFDQNFKGKKLSEKLNYLMNKNIQETKAIFSSIKSENIQQSLQQHALINIYYNLPKNQQQVFKSKIQAIIQEKFSILSASFDKSEQQKAIIEQKIRNILQKLPKELRLPLKDEFQILTFTLRQKEQAEVKNIKNQLALSSNIFQLVKKMFKFNNQTIQKECKILLSSQLKTLAKEMVVIGFDKKMKIVESFKAYLKYFGCQNHEIIKKINNNDELKEEFMSEQRSFLLLLINQQKEMIRQIENILIKCSNEQCLTFNKNCRQLNELYILAVEEYYDGMCPALRKQILSTWQNHVLKIKKEMKEMVPNLQINILHVSAIKTQKLLIKWKLIKNFIDVFVANSKKIMQLKGERFQFAKQYYKIFSQASEDKEALSKLSKQIDLLTLQLKNIKFYDEQIKILNFISLQSEFQDKIVNTLKVLKDYEHIYNQYLCERQQNQMQKNQLIESIRQKWGKNIQASMKQLQEAILSPDLQLSQRITITHNLAQIFIKKRWDIIDKQLKSKEQIEEFLQDKFDQINQCFQTDLINLTKIVNDSKSSNFENISNQLKDRISEITRQSQTKAQNVRKRIRFAVDGQAKRKLQLQLQNIQPYKNQAIYNAKQSSNQAYELQKQKNEQRLKDFIRENIVRHLIVMKKVINTVRWKSKDNQAKIIEFLQAVNDKSDSINNILYAELIASKNNYALMIAAESDIFKSQAAAQINIKTSGRGIQYVLEKCPQIAANPQLKTNVTNFYHIYEKQYNKMIDQFKKNPSPAQLQSVTQQLKSLKQRFENRRKDGTHPATIIGKIFGLWSMMKADISNKNDVSINFQPYPAQIVAIFFLVGSGETIKNSLVEVLTGEGKSIVLAGVCSYLAIKGFQPYCACYSEYLSERDNKEFKDLFDRLDISHKIKYGTFNQHCEEIINEIPVQKYSRVPEKFNFREIIKSILTNTKLSSKNPYESLNKIFNLNFRKQSKKILIIDEVDVFFNQNFLGELYYPSISLEDQQSKELIQYVWKVTKESRQNRDIKKISKQQIYLSNEFQQLATKYADIKELITNQVVGMIEAAYNFSHAYIIHDDSIKYRDNDSITDKISFGYKTVFANCHQYDRKAISQISYRAALKISLNIAPFSYAQLPTFFQSIVGVSGTVSQMSDYKKKILQQKYSLEQIYQIPSIYGDSKRSVDHFTIVKNEQFYDRIVEHTIQDERPIALFFKTIKDGVNFYKSPQFKEFTKNTTILTEQTDHEVREAIIKGVGQRGKITILTESFARGTDFKIFDSAVEGLGGLHVIQTFISSDLSEYIQTRGRTARQGNRGSFEVLISETELQRFEIDCKEGSQLQSRMKEAWRKKDEVECMNSRERVQKALEKHQKTQALFKKKLTQGDIVEFISSQNKLNEIRENNVKTLIGIDGTVSMGLALRKVFDILENSFSRTKKVLQDKKVVGSFQNQIAIYRNYDSDCDKLLEYSGFEADSQKLKEFLKKSSIYGGWGNEAMEILFQHANKMDKLDQIIIIADARANTAEETVQKRDRKGQSYWTSKGFSMTNQAEEMAKIKEKQIKVHTLYINLENSSPQKKTQLKQYCQLISKQTKGVSQEFKIKDQNASQFLTGFLVRNILRLIGGQQKGIELVESYDKDFSVPLRF